MTSQPLAQIIGRFNSVGSLGNTTTVTPLALIGRFTNTISNIIGVMTIVAGIWFIFQMVIGGISWLQAGGDKQAVENSRKRLQNAFMGLFIVVVSYAIIGIVGAFLGIDILGLYSLIWNLRPQ